MFLDQFWQAFALCCSLKILQLFIAEIPVCVTPTQSNEFLLTLAHIDTHSCLISKFFFFLLTSFN